MVDTFKLYFHQLSTNAHTYEFTMIFMVDEIILSYNSTIHVSIYEGNNRILYDVCFFFSSDHAQRRNYYYNLLVVTINIDVHNILNNLW